MIGKLLDSFGSWKRLGGASDDDWIDRLNHIWTVLLLTLFALVVSSSQFVGNPIDCWCPAQFTGAHVAYSKSICWISNTYYVPTEEGIPDNIEEREDQEITYYQWVPLIFLFQALMFKIPNITWHLLNSYSGINMDKVSTLASSTVMSSQDAREKNIYHIACYMNRWIDTHRDYHFNVFVRIRQKLSNVICFCLGKRDGSFLTGFYLFVKLLYCVNVIGQFFLLNAFMSMDYNVFGFEVMEFLFRTGKWKASPRFPRVTLCDFELRQLKNIQRWTVQCVLPINLFNEKMFIFLWFWFCFVAFLTCFNYLHWMYYIIFKENKTRYVKKFLKMTGDIKTDFDKKLSQKFANDYLRSDGVFLLRVVSKNSSDMVLTDLVHNLWNIFKEEHCKMSPKRETGPHVPSEVELMNGGAITANNKNNEKDYHV